MHPDRQRYVKNLVRLGKKRIFFDEKIANPDFLRIFAARTMNH